MKPSEKLKITDAIGRELQSRYTYREIDEYLGAFGISPPQNVEVNSKWVYTKAALRNVAPSKLAEITDDLGLVSLRQAV